MNISELRFFSKWYKNNFKGYKKTPGKPLLVHPNLDSVVGINDSPSIEMIQFQKGIYKTFTFKGLHYSLCRVKCETFKVIPDGISKEKAIPNHIDGNKLNDDVNNLEWTDYSGNLIHAFKSGLRNDNIFGVAEDIVEGLIYEFYSYNDLCRQINTHSGYLSYYMKKPRDYPFQRRYVITLKGQSRPNITKQDIWKAGVGSEMPIKVKNTETGEVTYHTSFTGMKKTLNVNYGQRERFIAGKIYSFGKAKHLVSVLTDYYDIMRTFETDQNFLSRSIDHVKYKTVKKSKIEVTYPSGDVKIFEDLDKAAIELGSTFAALQKRMSVANGTWKGHQLKYLSTSSRSVQKVISE